MRLFAADTRASAGLAKNEPFACDEAGDRLLLSVANDTNRKI